MKHKDYAKCSSSTDLIACAMQNAMITFLDREHIVPSLEKGHYLYHSTLNHALADDANPHQVCHAFIEIIRYSLDQDEYNNDFLCLFCAELGDAIWAHGERVHLIERQKHGRKFNR